MDRARPTPQNEPTPTSDPETGRDREGERTGEGNENPPYTTKGGVTAPKFGSATSGGGEVEPGPERD